MSQATTIITLSNQNTMSPLPLTIGLMEKLTIQRKGLRLLIGQFENCKAILEASNGIELKEQLVLGNLPKLLILELEIPASKGLETLKWLHENYVDVPVIILSAIDPELLLINILKNGVRAFLKKNLSPEDLRTAIFAVLSNGYYFTDATTRKLMKALFDSQNNRREKIKLMLSERELTFLEFASSELTYKEIAVRMKLSVKGIDKMRDRLFQNLDVKSRVGLTIKAVRNGIVSLNEVSTTV